MTDENAGFTIFLFLVASFLKQEKKLHIYWNIVLKIVKNYNQNLQFNIKNISA